MKGRKIGLLIIALISLAVINFLYYNEFIGESRVFVINGKSSGVISCDYKDWAFCDGVSFEIHKPRTQFLNGLNAKLVAVEEVGNVINYDYYSKKIAKKEYKKCLSYYHRNFVFVWFH